MEFPFTIHDAFKDIDSIHLSSSTHSDQTYSIFCLTNSQLTLLERRHKSLASFSNTTTKLANPLINLKQVVEKLGINSSRAQKLPMVITTYEKMRLSDHKLYVLINHEQNQAIGLIRTGRKHLFLLDRYGRNHEVEPICVLDFYVHESKQRKGLGNLLFKAMMSHQNIGKASFLAIDKPSQLFLNFLRRHHKLSYDIPQVNNYVVFEGFFSNENNLKQKNDRRYTQSAHYAKDRSRFRAVQNRHPDAVSNNWNNNNSGDFNKNSRSRTSLVGELLENDYDKKRHIFNAPPKSVYTTKTEPNPIEPTSNSNKIRPPSIADEVYSSNKPIITQTPQIDKINEKISDSLNAARLKQQETANSQILKPMNSVSSQHSNSGNNILENSTSSTINNGLKSILSSRELTNSNNFDRVKSGKSRNVRFPDIMPNKDETRQQNGNYSIYGHQPLKQQSSYHDVYNRPTQNSSQNFSSSNNRLQPSRSFGSFGSQKKNLNQNSFNSYKNQNANFQPLTAQKVYRNNTSQHMSNPNVYYNQASSNNNPNSYNPNRDRHQNYARSRGLNQESGWNLFGVPRTYSTLYR